VLLWSFAAPLSIDVTVNHLDILVMYIKASPATSRGLRCVLRVRPAQLLRKVYVGLCCGGLSGSNTTDDSMKS